MRRLLLAVGLAVLAPASRVESRSVDLNVFAATSLREAFGEIAARFETEHPGTRVTLNFAGSQELATQIEHGATADVFASADAENLERLVSAKLAAEGRVFARNVLVVVVSREAATTVRRFADLPLAERIVLGGPEVPIGRYARQVLDRSSQRYGADFRRRVEAHLVSNELNVRQALAKVSLGEADAAIVYRTDAAAAADRVEIVDIPAEVTVEARYPVALLVGAPHPELAQRWVEALLSAQGQRTLAGRGFLPASDADGGAQ